MAIFFPMHVSAHFWQRGVSWGAEGGEGLLRTPNDEDFLDSLKLSRTTKAAPPLAAHGLMGAEAGHRLEILNIAMAYSYGLSSHGAYSYGRASPTNRCVKYNDV